MKIFILFRVLLTFLTANAACLDFARVDSFFESYGFTEDSRKVLSCAEKLKSPNQSLDQLIELKTSMSEKINGIIVHSAEITTECDRTCVWNKKVAATFRAVIRDHWAKNQLVSDQQKLFLSCFESPSRENRVAKRNQQDGTK